MTESIRLFRGPFGHVSLLNVGGNLVTHAHPEAHIVIWLAGAPGRMTVGERTIRPERGVAIGIISFEPHNHVFSEGEVPGQFLAFYIDMDWLRSRRGLPMGADAFHCPDIPLDGWMAANIEAQANTAAQAILTSQSYATTGGSTLARDQFCAAHNGGAPPVAYAFGYADPWGHAY